MTARKRKGKPVARSKARKRGAVVKAPAAKRKAAPRKRKIEGGSVATHIKDVMPSSTVRQRFAEVCNYVIRSRTPVHITRKGEDVVMLAADEYAGLMELLHLLRSPANAQHLIESIAQADRGELVEFDPTE